MLGRLLPLAIAAAALSPATAAAKPHKATYEVVKATHSSTSQKVEDGYSGRSEAVWRLRKGTRLTLQDLGGGLNGLTELRVRGSYSIDVTTDWPGRCAWTEETGETEHAGMAPDRVPFGVSPHPRKPGKLLVAFNAPRATLSNGYLGTECSTSVSGEPDTDDTNGIVVGPKAFKRRTVRLKTSGQTAENGIAYRWSTSFVLKRVKR